MYTRNRTNPYNGITKWYVLSDQPGNHVAQLSGTYQGNLSDQFSAITAADVSDDGERMVLLARGAVHVFTQPTGDNFLSGNVSYNFFTFTSGLEGISFRDNCTVMISEEAQGSTPARIWSLNTCQIVTGLEESSQDQFNVHVRNGFLNIELTDTDAVADELIISDLSGATIMSAQRVNNMPIDGLKPGIYLLTVLKNGRSFSKRFTNLY